MVGYWNIFAIDGHICDRLFAEVTDPFNPDAPPPSPAVPLNYKPNFAVIGLTAAVLSGATLIAYFGTRNQTRKITSLRTVIQIGFVFLIFFGIFIDHYSMPVPAEQIAPHEVLIADNAFGVGLPDGLPVPFFACYYPCGKTVTCAFGSNLYLPFFNAGGGWGVHYDSTGLARLAIVFGSIIVGAIILGRVFCGWVCPFGLYLDLMTRLRKAVKVKRRMFSDKFNTHFHQLGYVILALIIFKCSVRLANAHRRPTCA